MWDRDPGQGRSHDSDTAEDEVLGPMGVMDVAGTMQHIEHLAGLGDAPGAAGHPGGVVEGCLEHNFVRDGLLRGYMRGLRYVLGYLRMKERQYGCR